MMKHIKNYDEHGDAAFAGCDDCGNCNEERYYVLPDGLHVCKGCYIERCLDNAETISAERLAELEGA